MFQKILIANRGEIACRIIKTARQLGVATVAVYSDADRRALHVRMADEAVYIGGAAATESYLKGDVILQAAKDTGADAIHPGYGFLSENAGFAEICEAAGVKFIGPSAASMRAMGLKDKAKEIMEKAGVPVVPGYRGEKQDVKTLQAEAENVGYPVLIKAVAGGGGKGMRLVDSAKDFVAFLEACKREAHSSFANDHVLIEKYITKPRHVEVQVFGDSHGNAVHLFERDCSLQRRHQKVVEEAPAPGLSDKTRTAMGAAAVTAVQALGYENAGTIEFIMDSETQDFFFMEMNTRLQVEHPVTEMITGVDLVEWQLLVAAGEKLPLAQDEIKLNGHAFEVRLYAEDPANDFLPQTGRIEGFTHPHLNPLPYGGREGRGCVRLDTGVETGDSVTIHYDPMIAKLIVHGKNRREALDKMRVALAETALVGLVTNQEFLHNVFTQADFIKGAVDTGFIAQYMDHLLPENYGRPGKEELALAAVWFVTGMNERRVSCPDPWNDTDNWRMGGPVVTPLKLMSRGEAIELMVTSQGDGIKVEYGDKEFHIVQKALNGNVLTVELDKREVSGSMIAHGRDLTILREGRVVPLHLYIHGSGDDDEAGEGRILASMPGKIVDVLVKKGDEVAKDQPLLIMEAMKMEMTIKAGCAGIVEELTVSANDQVADGALLVAIKSGDAA